MLQLLMQTRNFSLEDRTNGSENSERTDGQCEVGIIPFL